MRKCHEIYWLETNLIPNERSMSTLIYQQFDSQYLSYPGLIFGYIIFSLSPIICSFSLTVFLSLCVCRWCSCRKKVERRRSTVWIRRRGNGRAVWPGSTRASSTLRGWEPEKKLMGEIMFPATSGGRYWHLIPNTQWSCYEGTHSHKICPFFTSNHVYWSKIGSIRGMRSI